MNIATSRNMTIVGVATIAGAIGAVVTAIYDGDPMTTPDWGAAAVAIVAGIGMILGKGALSTGGTVPETPEAAKRVQEKPTDPPAA